MFSATKVDQTKLLWSVNNGNDQSGSGLTKTSLTSILLLTFELSVPPLMLALCLGHSGAKTKMKEIHTIEMEGK